MKQYLIIIFTLIVVPINAQIGINTENPLSSLLLHIDAKKDTSGTNNTDDDVVITTNGNVGVGTIAPTSSLTVNGSFRINDGSQAQDYILVSDADGIGTWRNVTVNKYITWTLSGSLNFPGYVQVPLYDASTVTSTLTANEILGASLSGGTVTLPEGRYLLLVNGDQAVTEYGVFEIMMNGALFQSFMVINSLAGGTSLFYTSIPVDIEMMFTPIFPGSNHYSAPPYTTTFNYAVTIIQLRTN